MDWEKQDNELRKLMENADFLPDAEQWDGKASWQKFCAKRSQNAETRKPNWQKWAAAACCVGLLGLGSFLHFAPFGASEYKSNTETANTAIGNDTSMMNAGSIKPKEDVSALSPSGLNKPVKQEYPKGSTKQISAKELEKAELYGKAYNSIPTAEGVGDKEASTVQPNKTEGFVSDTEFMAIVNPQQAETPTTPPLVLPSTKTKMKVVHFNSMFGGSATSPPVFVQSNKKSDEMDGLVWQPESTKREYLPSLKFDISPAPKKSL